MVSPRAYYNEVDRAKAEWLRELIKANVIAPGVVDERSITNVLPADLVGFTQCHFFAGIGVWSYALRLAGWPDDRPCWTGSCPCPSFSAAGKGLGFADPRHLWPEWYRLIRESRPRTIFGEQVDDAIGHGWLDLVCGDLEATGYAIAPAVLGAHSAGAPHIRQRLYFLAHLHERESEIRRESRGAQSQGLQSRGHVDGCYSPCLLADTGCSSSESQRFRVGEAAEGPEGAGDQRQRLRSDARDGELYHSLVHAERDGGRADLEGRGSEGRTSTRGRSTTSSLADAELSSTARLGRDSGPSSTTGRLRSGSSDSGIVGIPPGQRREGLTHRGPDVHRPGGTTFERTSRESLGPVEGRGPAGPLNGYWRTADWLRCRDGRWRPVEAGTFPLADGTPGRVGLLRGYGDAIVAPTAAEFIAAAIEVIG